MSQARINTSMLTWARERLGLDIPAFAEKLRVEPDKVYSWESGQQAITFLKAKQFSEKAYIPFGYLFLDQPPVDKLPIPDLRTVNGLEPGQPSAELVDIIKIMLQRQEWYREYQNLSFSDPVAIVGRFNVGSNVNTIVDDIRTVLKMPISDVRGKWDEYYRMLVKRIEAAGVLVMREGFIGHFTRPLNVEEFRGFAMVDEYAPLIFVNHADSYGARMFTLIHELCHIYIGQSGISNSDSHTNRREEILCNAVAAEFLVPEQEFLSMWTLKQDSLHVNLLQLESHFHVSTWVLARRALTLNLITSDQYRAYIASRKAAYEKNKNSKVSHYRAKHSQLSDHFAKAVVSEALGGQLMLREASNLLGGMKPANIPKFAKELQV